MKKLHKFSTTIEAIPFSIAIFTILLFQKTSPILSGGEEQYLAYAKQAMNPEWIKNSFTLTEKPGSRLLFQWIVGTCLKYLSFESFTVIARILNYLLYAIALGQLFKKLQFPKLWTLLVFQLYILGKQSFFAGEWIFESFEPKTLAYACLFFALNTLLDRKIFVSALLLAIGTYFHFLVTGWFVICLGIYWIIKKEWKLLLPFCTWFLLQITPLTIYMYETILKHSSHFINGINLDWIYCYGRLYHHLGIAISWDYFLSKQLPGIVMAMFILFVLVKFKNRIKELDFFRSISVIAIILSLFFVVVALYDSFILNQYALFPLKTYPFRPMALAQLFSYLILGVYLSKRVTHRTTAPLLSLILIVLFVAQTIKNYEFYTNYKAKTDSFSEMATYIKTNTNPESVFHHENLHHPIPETFIRITEREALYVHKFTPADSEKMYQRYMITNDIGGMLSGTNHVIDLQKKYHLDYIVSEGSCNVKDLQLIANFNNFFLYQFKK